MFDIGFSELLLIAIVALVVLGPERLPRVARTAGHLIGRFQRYANQVKSDINREMQIEDLKKMRAEVEQAASSLQSTVTREAAAIEAGLNEAGGAVKAEVSELAAVAQTVEPPLDAARLRAAADAAQDSVVQMEQALANMLAQSPAAPEPATQSAVSEAGAVESSPPASQLALGFDNPPPATPPAQPGPRSAA